MYARDCAVWRTALFGEEFAANVLFGVVGDRDARISALLGAVMDQAVFADIEITGPGAAFPIVWPAHSNIVLKIIQASITGLANFFQLLEYGQLFIPEWTNLSTAIVNDAHGGRKAEVNRTVRDGEGILRILNARADDRIDVHVKVGVFSQQLQFLVENLERFLGYLVRHDVIDGDLHVLESGLVEALDAFGGEQIAVGNHGGNHAVSANLPENFVEIGME